MFKVQKLFIIWLWLCTKFFTNAFKFNEILSSKMVEFQWPDMETRARAEMNGLYIPGHNVPLGLDRWNDKLFITVPRYVATFFRQRNCRGSRYFSCDEFKFLLLINYNPFKFSETSLHNCSHQN